MDVQTTKIHSGLPQHAPSHIAHSCCYPVRSRHVGTAKGQQHLNRASQRLSVIRRGFGDDLLDFIEGMPSGH